MAEEIDFVKEYESYKEEYELPEFEELARDFDIEKVSEKESSFLIREIRRVIIEKLSSYLSLFETLINPASPPMYIFSVLRGISEEDKSDIRKVYKRLSKFQIKSLKLETIYEEADEARFIKDAFNEWQKIKLDVFKIIEKFEKNVEKENNSKKSGYFG